MQMTFYNPGALSLVNDYFINNKIDFLFGSVKNINYYMGINHGKLSLALVYTSHSVGFIKRLKHIEVGKYSLDYLSSDLDFLQNDCKF